VVVEMGRPLDFILFKASPYLSLTLLMSLAKLPHGGRRRREKRKSDRRFRGREPNSLGSVAHSLPAGLSSVRLLDDRPQEPPSRPCHRNAKGRPCPRGWNLSGRGSPKPETRKKAASCHPDREGRVSSRRDPPEEANTLGSHHPEQSNLGPPDSRYGLQSRRRNSGGAICRGFLSAPRPGSLYWGRGA
jgi:hypothetical protein